LGSRPPSYSLLYGTSDGGGVVVISAILGEVNPGGVAWRCLWWRTLYSMYCGDSSLNLGSEGTTSGDRGSMGSEPKDAGF